MEVYKITNRVSGKAYIGRTLKTTDWRWKGHLSAASRGLAYVFYDALRKHGAEQFQVEVLWRGPSRRLMNELEQYFIVLHGTKLPHGYNSTDGGDGSLGHVHAPETRSRISQALRGQKHTLERRANLRLSHLGNGHTPETRAKISATMQARLQTPEARQAQRRHFIKQGS